MTTQSQIPVRPNSGPRPPGGPGMSSFTAGPTAKSMDFKGSGKRLLSMLRPERRMVFGVLLMGVASVTLAVIGPKILANATNAIVAGVIGQRLPAGLSQQQAADLLRSQGQDSLANIVVTNDVIPGEGINFDSLAHILMIALLAYIFSSVLSWLQGRITTGIVQRTIFGLRGEVEAKLARLPLSYFDRLPRGEILSRVTNDIDNVAQTLQQSLSQIVTSVLTIIGVLAMMFWISPLLAVVSLITIPLSVGAAAVIGKQAQPQFVAQWGTTGKLNAHIEEMYTGHSLVKVFGRADESAEIFAELNERLYESSFKAQFISGIIQPALTFIGNLNYVFVAVVGGLQVTTGAISIGSVQAFIQYSRQFSQPITQVASLANLLQSGVASVERVFEFLDADEQSPDPLDSHPPHDVRGRVAFEHVAFRYQPETPLIEDLSLTVEPGHTVAIVGPTGAGKTTLVNLIMRFYEVSGGRITLDGRDITTMTRDELRSNIGMVLQDTWLFGGTVAENIAYGVDSATPDQIVAAARATYVDRFVRTLPDGYETVLDDDGSSVSAGEKQLITIARAFLAEPLILILDEATSSVDTRTEVLIQRAMSTLRKGRTSFVIAHRLSTIRDADTILVMEDGQIVEQGNHDDLLAANGAYARLYAAQFSQAVEVEA